MDEDSLVNRIQTLLLGMEERTHRRLDGMDARLNGVDARLNGIDARLDRVDARLDRVEARLEGMDGRLGSLETKMDSVHRELTLNNELLAPFIRWSHRVEDEIIRLSSQLQDVQARLKKLENPNPTQ